MGRLIEWGKWMVDGPRSEIARAQEHYNRNRTTMTRDEYVAELRRVQSAYERNRRIQIICAIVVLTGAVILLCSLLAGCQVPLKNE
jgi:hypothetical protein